MKPYTCNHHTPPVLYQPVYRAQPCPVCQMTVDTPPVSASTRRLPTVKVLTRRPVHHKAREGGPRCLYCSGPLTTQKHYCSRHCAGKGRKGLSYEVIAQSNAAIEARRVRATMRALEHLFALKEKYGIPVTGDSHAPR